MGFLDFIGWPRAPEPEQRMITSIPGIEQQGFNWSSVINVNGIQLPPVNSDTALTVPAFAAGVAFLSRSLASLPLHAFRKGADGSQKIVGGLETLIHEAPNPEWTSFGLRRYFWQQVFTGGRGLIWIERSGSNITGLYPMNPPTVSIKRDGMGRTTYTMGDKTYPAADVIDVPFMLKADGIGHYGPVVLGAGALQLALAMSIYGSNFFAGGGIPPLAVEGPMEGSPEAMRRALTEINKSIKAAQEESIPIARMPPGYKLSPIGFDPDKGQMTDARKFQIEEIARVLQIPPVFLQDLSHGTYSNTEQQDLHLAKHLISQWAQCLEEEMNLKLFGQRNGGRFVEHNLDGLMRGDFVARMNGLAQAVNTAILTPNEARALENRPAMANGDSLMIQGATVPLGTQPTDAGTPAPVEDNTQ